jgi:C_GCAxxG_C_C family probable redox protein
MSKFEEAYAKMADRRMNCAQSVLSTYCDKFGLDGNLALALAQGFGRGMGRGKNNCGAVSGAYMVINLACGISPANPRQSVDKAYDQVTEFTRRFRELYPSLVCEELIGYDVGTPEGLAVARSTNIFTTVCPGLVRDASRILEEMLDLW